MTSLGAISQFDEKKFYGIQNEEQRLLLIHQNGVCHLLENKCGHFEVALDEGSLEDGAIRCPIHGITFG
jgi:nitrite reductase/ring-hydroxylating ferredoxin subunit